MTRRVVLVVPDAGPLISLGRAGSLDILLALELPIWIVDQVLHEVTADPRFADAEQVAGFIRNNPDVVRVFSTVVGEAAMTRRAAGYAGRQPGLGEAAIAEFLARLDEVVVEPDDPVMLLYEDSDIRQSRFVLPANVHVVSTRALLLGMQQRGLIGSADAVWRAILATGRRPADTAADQPGAVANGDRTRW